MNEPTTPNETPVEPVGEIEEIEDMDETIKEELEIPPDDVESDDSTLSEVKE